MKLTILGSGSFIPTAKRNCSGYLLDVGEETVLLDGGSGTLRQIFRAEHSVLEIRRVFYSHFHLDHIADFLPLLFTRKYSKPQRPTMPLDIYAHRGFQYYYDNLTKIFEKWVIDDEFPPSFYPIEPGEYNFPGYKLTVYPSNHTPESLMYRFESEEQSLLYTGDVDLCDELITAAWNVDLLLIECGNTDENYAAGHMNPGKIRKLMQSAHPKSVILTHIPPELENLNLEKAFGPELAPRVTIAEDLQEIVLTQGAQRTRKHN